MEALAVLGARELEELGVEKMGQRALVCCPSVHSC
jgi:hypothetical protein